MAVDLKVSKEAFEFTVIFSQKSSNQPNLKLKTKQQKALEALVIQKKDVLVVLNRAANQKLNQNGFYQMCLGTRLALNN